MIDNPLIEQQGIKVSIIMVEFELLNNILRPDSMFDTFHITYVYLLQQKRVWNIYI